ncbi:hypothetical protein OMES3154_00648 [Oceanivirga miroungae]|uniref:Type I restriction modification DNA specificity domain-containing protein n=2 Tax=Oceanivirga miroungae TaxID=1130046 RepID=A0A6I8MAZ1_9FUSO|nr:hypothetical protein OMES3154_00648 [Oceanivirga miroungae]
MAEQFTTLSALTIDGKGSYGIGARAVPFSKDLYTYLRITDIKDDGTLNLQDLKSVDDEKASEYLLKPNDIVFARTGASTGRNYFYDGTDGEFVYAGFLIKFSIDEKKVNPKYIKYFCQSKQYKDWINSFNTGSTRGNINAQTLGKMPIPLIERKIQDILVSVLSSIDEKIKKNNEINNNLEQQASALFKSWFVDFEPFGYAMPSNWEVATLDTIADFQNGYAFKSKDLLSKPAPNTYKVFKQGHISRGGGFISDGTKSWYPKSSATSLGKFILRKGDILMAMTDMKDNVAILGNTAIMPVDNEYIVNQRVGHLRANNYKGITYPYIYLLTNNKNFLTDLRSRANSGVQVNLSSAEIKLSEIVIATEKINKAFSDIVMPMCERIIQNQLENQRLAVLRDTLIPKLMSGELDVSNIDL